MTSPATSVDPSGEASPDPDRHGRLRVRLLALGLVLVVVAAGAGIVRTRQVAAEEGLVSTTGRAPVRHVSTPVAYGSNPPSRGDHHAVWWDCGVYDRPVPPEHAVHSLEHGAVWLTYRPDVPAATLATLERLAERTYLILSPLPEQRWPVVATAWEVQLQQERFDAAAVERFIVEHRMGPGAPEQGASCTNGTTRDLVRRP